RTTGPDKAKLVPVPVEHAEGVNGEATRVHLQAKMPQGNHAAVNAAGPVPVRASSAPYSPPSVSKGSTIVSLAPVPASLQYNSLGGGSGGYGMSSGSVSLNSTSIGLPSASMGKFVHQPGDNKYAPGWQGPVSSARGSQVSSFRTARAESDYGAGSLDGPTGAAYGTAGGALSAAPSAAGSRSVNSSAVRGRLLQRIEGANAAAASHEERDSRDKVSQKKEQMQAESEKNKAAQHTVAKAEDLSSPKIDAALRVLAESILKDGKNADKLVNGRLKVNLELSVPADAKLISKLQKLGFHVSKHNGKTVLGKIAPKSLAALALLEAVLTIKLDDSHN
ncbi:MAG: hypothetical protein K2X81_02455, partial [Candidatus Obscuribacterales bacterium]|nr:hypothetical protein [Candidatus Obscuribacterales bacterium]